MNKRKLWKKMTHEVYSVVFGNLYYVILGAGVKTKLYNREMDELIVQFKELKNVSAVEFLEDNKILLRTRFMYYTIYDVEKREYTWSFQFKPHQEVNYDHMIRLSSSQILDQNPNYNKKENRYEGLFVLNIETGEIEDWGNNIFFPYWANSYYKGINGYDAIVCSKPNGDFYGITAKEKRIELIASGTCFKENGFGHQLYGMDRSGNVAFLENRHLSDRPCILIYNVFTKETLRIEEYAVDIRDYGLLQLDLSPSGRYLATIYVSNRPGAFSKNAVAIYDLQKKQYVSCDSEVRLMIGFYHWVDNSFFIFETEEGRESGGMNEIYRIDFDE